MCPEGEESGRPRVAVRLGLCCCLLGHGRMGSYHPMIVLSVALQCLHPKCQKLFHKKYSIRLPQLRHTVGQTVFSTAVKAKINVVLFLFMKGTNLRPKNNINSITMLFCYHNNKHQVN